MRQRGRPITAAIFGFLAGLFGAVSLLAFGVIPLDSLVVTVLPVITLVIGFALAMWAPIGKSKQRPMSPGDTTSESGESGQSSV